MSDINVNQEITEPVQNTTSEPTEVELRAIEQGWKPKEQFEGDPAKWRPAQEFLDRGELFTKIDSMGKELRETRKALKMLQEHHSKVKDVEFKRAVDELKALQKQHLENGNSEEYVNTTEILTDLKAEQKAREVVQQQTKNSPDPRFSQWVEKNSWYAQNSELREYADYIGTRYAQEHPDLEPTEVLEYVEKQTKKTFKDKFENPNRSKPNAVEGAGAPASKKTDESVELTADERKVMQTFVRQGIMTADEYIKQIKSMKKGA